MSVNKSYSIMNLSYRDTDRTEDYLLERTQGKPTFHMPISIDNIHTMYPSDMIEMICQDTTKELGAGNLYTQTEVNNLIQDLKLDVARSTDDIFVSKYNGYKINETPENNERLLLNESTVPTK